jgi:peptidoglycan/LPS O-acetylase OafA/YrhL
MNHTPLRHVAYLDGWRGLAIIAVLIAHFGPKSTAWMGALGVQLFFVLSGYLMGGLLFIKNVPLTDFFARRFSRVVPTFLLFILTMALYAGTLQPRPYGDAD